MVTYGAAVSACARAGRNARLVSAAARELLATLWGLHAAAAADGLGPDQYMIHCLAVACGRVGDAEGAIRVMDAGAGPRSGVSERERHPLLSHTHAHINTRVRTHTHPRTRART